jgi:hypothetical protein
MVFLIIYFAYKLSLVFTFIILGKGLIKGKAYILEIHFYNLITKII